MRSPKEQGFLDLKIKEKKEALQKVNNQDRYLKVELLFLEAIRDSDKDKKKRALQAGSQWVRKFFVNNNLSQYLHEFNLVNSDKTIFQSMGHVNDCRNDNPVVDMYLTLFFPLIPLVIIGNCISGMVDHATRNPLDEKQLGDFFVSLERITATNDRKTVINKILQKYDDDPFYKKHSNASATLLNYLRDVSLTIDDQWDHLINYVIDIERNNGKALFQDIADTVNLHLTSKFEFQKFKLFGETKELPSELTQYVQKFFIQKTEADDKSQQPSPITIGQ